MCKRLSPVAFQALDGFVFVGTDMRAVRCARACLVTRKGSRGRLELFVGKTDPARALLTTRSSLPSGPEVGMPTVLVPADRAVAQVWGAGDHAVTVDGQRYLVKTRVEEDDRRIHVILNWTSLLE